MTKIGVGIIGAGQIAALHAKGYLADDRVRLRAVCDARESLAIDRALEWGAERYFTNFREVLADPEVHAIDIATPHHLHARIALDALRAGKHVIVQRPLALNVAEADNLVREARARNLTLACMEWTVFVPAIQDAKTYLETGEIGDPISCRIKVSIGAPEGGWKVRPESWLWRFDDQKCGGGPFLFDAIYGAFVAAGHLLGPADRLTAAIGRTEIYPGYYVDAPATAMWRHKWRSCPGTLEVSYSPELYIKSSHYPSDARIEITGSKGIMWARYSPGNVTMGPALQMYRDGRMFSFGEVKDTWDESFEAATRNFVDAIYGIDPLVFNAESGREMLRMTLAARESSQTDRVQKLF